MKKLIIASIFLFSLASNAHAVFVSYDVVGRADYADIGNKFGLSKNDLIRANVRFDDGLISGASYEEISLGEMSGNSLAISVGLVQLTEAQDTGYTRGFPKIEFTNGQFSGINFDSTNIFGLQTSQLSNSYLQSVGSFVNGEDADNNLITANWQLDNFTVVPLPAAVWLFVFGLVGLVRLAKR